MNSKFGWSFLIYFYIIFKVNMGSVRRNSTAYST
jgi:hypothetical protein